MTRRGPNNKEPSELVESKTASLPKPTAGAGEADAASESAPTPKQPHAIWTSADDETLVGILKAQRTAGNQVDNGWKKVAWTAATAALVGASRGGVKSWTGCRDHWRLLVQDYNTVHFLRYKISGFGWDPETKTVTATSQVWESTIETHSDIAKFRGKSFPLYDDNADLVEGRQATGKAAYWVPTESQASALPSQSSASPLNDDSRVKSTDFEFTYSRSASPHTPSSSQKIPSTPERGRPSTWSVSGTTRKHRCSPSSRSSASPAPCPSTKHTRITGPVAVNNVAGAMSQVANSISAAATEIATPTRWQKAVWSVINDDSLSDTVKVQAIKLFTKDIAVCDSYLAIDKLTLHNTFLTSVLNEE